MKKLLLLSITALFLLSAADLRATVTYISTDIPASTTTAPTYPNGEDTVIGFASAGLTLGYWTSYFGQQNAFTSSNDVAPGSSPPVTFPFPYTPDSNSYIVLGFYKGSVFGNYYDTNGVSHGFYTGYAVGPTNALLTTLDYPGSATGSTYVTFETDGGIVAGTYVDSSSVTRDFVYDGTNYSTIDATNATNIPDALPGTTGIVGLVPNGRVVGEYIDSNYDIVSFISDGTNYTVLDPPEGYDSSGVLAAGGDGVTTYVCGFSFTQPSTYVYHIFDGTNYTPIDVSYSTNITNVTFGNTSITAVDYNGVVVGSFIDNQKQNHAYFFDGTNYTALDDPEPYAVPLSTVITGISYGTVFGTFSDASSNSYGFTYQIGDSNSWHTFLGPNGGATLTSLDGTNVAGYYQDIMGFYHSFTGGYSSTEPSTLSAPFAQPFSTFPVAISGTNVAGSFTDPNSGRTYGFLSSGTNYTPVYGPQGTNSTNQIEIIDISGHAVLGQFFDTNTGTPGGFLFDGTNYTTFFEPEGPGIPSAQTGLSYVSCYDGTNVTGLYHTTNGPFFYGFLYSKGSYRSLYGPGGTNVGITSIGGISHGVVYGTYPVPALEKNYGFLYSNGKYSPVYGPEGTNGSGVDNLLGYSPLIGTVGSYSDSNYVSRSFIYDGTNYTTLDYAKSAIVGVGFTTPKPGTTQIAGVSSNRIAGTYQDIDGLTHPFYAIVSYPQPLPGVTTNGISFSIGGTLPLPSTNSNGSVVSYSVSSGPGGLSSNSLSFLGAGTITLVRSLPGTPDFNPVSATNTYVIPKLAQHLGAFSIPGITFSSASTSIAPPASSSALPVMLKVISGAGTLSNNLFTPTGAGPVVIQASQSGNSNYLAATPVSASFSVAKAPQALSAATISPGVTYGSNVPIVLNTAIGVNSGLPVTYTIAGPAKITNGIFIPTGAGIVTIKANQAGNANFLAAPQITTTVVIAKAPQTIAPFTVANRMYTNTPFTIPLPVASSGAIVTLSVVSGPAKIVGNKITLTGAGTVVLSASQAGNANYLPAIPVRTSFTVTPLPQTIAPMPPIPSKTYPAAPFQIKAPLASSGLLVTLSVASGPATIAGGKVTLTGSGTVTIAANQPGNSIYAPASPVFTIFSVASL